MTTNGGPSSPQFAARYAAERAAFDAAMTEADELRRQIEEIRLDLAALRIDNDRLRADRELLMLDVTRANHVRAEELQKLRDRDIRLRAKAEVLGHAFADFLGELNDERPAAAAEPIAGSSPPGEAQSQSPGDGS